MKIRPINLKTAVNRLEDAIITLSGPALAISGILAGVDLVTGGSILKDLPILTLAWAICLLLTLDFQVLALGVRTRRAYISNASTRRKIVEIAIMVLVAAAISYVSIQMQSIIARTNSAGVSIDQAALQLGINPLALIWERSILVLVLIFMSGWFRDSSEHPISPVPAPRIEPVQPDVNALFERLEATYAQRIEALVERTVERVTISIESQQQQQLPAPALPENTGTSVYALPEQEISSIGSTVQVFIEQQRQVGIEPTISAIMDATGCSKGTASRYKNRK